MAVLLESYSESNQDAEQYEQSGGNLAFGQSWKTPAGAGYDLDSCKFYIRKSASGTNTGTMVARLYADSGTFGTTITSGPVLATSDGIDLSTLTTSLTLTTFNFSGANRYSMTANVAYIISIEMQTAPTAPAALYIGYDSTSPSHAGIMGYDGYGAINAALAGNDLCFYVYGVLTPAASATTNTSYSFFM